jgi:hypothetical protein
LLPTLVEHPRHWEGLVDEHRHAELSFVMARDLGSFGHLFDPTVAVTMAWGSFIPPQLGTSAYGKARRQGTPPAGPQPQEK